MDFNDTKEEAAFRAEVRDWLADHAPKHVISPGQELSDTEQVARGKAWQREKYDGGYAGITLPKSLGGRGGTIIDSVVFDEEEGRFELPKGPYIGIGLGMALPVIGNHGTPEQIEKFVDATLKGELTWCQLFSEPSAGSDLAAVRTRAVKDGEQWVVNGQKVWSSWAHHSDWGILVVRTDPGVVKHKGLSFFVIDMKSPGVEVRPIRQISGASDFNETFLTDVRIPDGNMLGAAGDGWACCMTVLLSERLGQGEEGKIKSLMRYAADTPVNGGSQLDDASVKIALATAYAEERAQNYLQARLRTMVSRGESPGALAAMMKLSYAGRLQRTSGLAMEVRGASALAVDANDSVTREIWCDYIWASALRIAGGADEVLRNQISERVLGMPGEMRADKGVPFSDLK